MNKSCYLVVLFLKHHEMKSFYQMKYSYILKKKAVKIYTHNILHDTE